MKSEPRKEKRGYERHVRWKFNNPGEEEVAVSGGGDGPKSRLSEIDDVGPNKERERCGG